MVAIDLITEHIRMKLQQHDLRRIYPNLEVIPSNFQIRGMHTIIRDHSTHHADFVFYADRLLRLVSPAPPFTRVHVPLRGYGSCSSFLHVFSCLLADACACLGFHPYRLAANRWWRQAWATCHSQSTQC